MPLTFTDSKVPRDIVLDPRLGAAEAFMDGRLTLQQGGIMELVELLRANTPWDRGGSIGPPSPLRRLSNRIALLRGRRSTTSWARSAMSRIITISAIRSTS